VHNIVISVPFAVVVSVILVALGAILATSPATGGLWISNAVAGVALFAAIIYTGTAIRRRRNRRH
jgi:hypothetical protein